MRGRAAPDRRADPQGGLSVETIPNLEHTLLERTGRDRVSALLHAHVTCVVGAGGSRPAGRGAMSLRP